MIMIESLYVRKILLFVTNNHNKRTSQELFIAYLTLI